MKLKICLITDVYLKALDIPLFFFSYLYLKKSANWISKSMRNVILGGGVGLESLPTFPLPPSCFALTLFCFILTSMQ